MTITLTYLKHVLSIVMLTILIACTPKLKKAKSTTNELNIPGYQITQLMAEEDFSQDLKNWQTEGSVKAYISNGRLHFVSTDSLIKNPKGNIWWKHEFESPYVLEFDYQNTTEHGLTMLFWNAQTLSDNDFLKSERTGKYEEYVNGDMQTYHFSFHRFSTGVSNLRKSPGFHLLDSVSDPVSPLDKNAHKIHIASLGNKQLIFFDYQLILEFTDKSEPCIAHKKWQHPLPCKGTGAIPNKGYIGIRHTQKQEAFYDNFKVYRLKKE